MNTLELIQKYKIVKAFNNDWSKGAETIANTLVCMKPQNAAEVFKKLSVNAQIDVILNILKNNENDLMVGGIETVTEFLNLFDRNTVDKIIIRLNEKHEVLIDEMQKRIGIFKDIIMMEDNFMEDIFSKIDTHELAIALKSVDSETHDKIFRTMQRVKKIKLQEEMEFLGPMDIKDVEEMQWKIIKFIIETLKTDEIYGNHANVV